MNVSLERNVHNWVQHSWIYIHIHHYPVHILYLMSWLDHNRILKRSLRYSNKTFLETTNFQSIISEPAITCSKLTTETLEQGVKHVQSSQ